MTGFRGTERFEVIRQLGAGGMGVVYEALDRQKNTRVALKTLKEATGESLFHLKQEFCALQALRHHNLVELGELIENSDPGFFTMELVLGEDLLTYIRGDDRRGRPDARSTPSFDEDRLRHVLGQLAQGIEALHRAGKVHRDLKPSNVMVTPEGRVVIMDFGLVVATTDMLDPESAGVAGTAAYMAPEQAEGAAVTPAADWYSVGVMLYRALTGRLPTDRASAETARDGHGEPPTLPSLEVAGVPEDLEELCMALLADLPGKRADGAAVLQCATVMRQRTAPPAMPAPSTHGAPFVGRAQELATLQQAYADMRAGRAVTVAIYGQSGIGKSALVRRFVHSVRHEEPRPVLLSGHCYEHEAAPFNAFDGVIDALARFLRRLPEPVVQELLGAHADRLPRVFSALSEVPALARESLASEAAAADPQELRKRAFQSLRDLLGRVGERHPLIVAIDDIQWADRDSALLLEDLLHPPGEPRLLLVLAARPEGRESQLFTRATREVRIAAREQREIVLAPLQTCDAEELADLLLARDGIAASWKPQEIVREAGGHPLFMDELVRHAAAGATSLTSLSLHRALHARIADLPGEARQVLELVALADAPLSEETLRLAARVPPDDLARVVGFLAVSSLLRRTGASAADAVQPYHDRVREAVRASLDEALARQRHRWLAEALSKSDQGLARPDLLITHLSAAGRTVEASRCATQAAQRASEAMAFGRAADLYRIALRAGDPLGRDAVALRLRLAESLVNAGRFAEAAPVYLDAARGADRSTSLECRLQAANKWIASGHVDEGLAIFTELLPEIGDRMPRTPRAALASLVWQRMVLRLRGLGFTPRPVEEIPSRDLQRLDLYHGLAGGLGLVDNLRGARFQARRLRLALRTGEPVRVGVALAYEALYLSSQGGSGLRRAAMLTQRVTDLARDQESLLLKAWALGARAWVTYFRGEFASAAVMAEKGEALFCDHTVGTHWERSTARLFRCLALRYRGDLKGLAPVYSEALVDAARRGNRYLETTLRRRVSLLALAADDADAARVSLAAAPWAPPAGRYHLQHYYALVADAELAVYSGGGAARAMADLAAEFGRLDQSLLTRMQSVRAEAAWIHGRLDLAATVETGADDRLAHARRCARRLGRESIGYARVWGQLLTAGIHGCRGDLDAAAPALRTALAGAVDHDLPLCAAVARYCLGQLVQGSEGAALVTEAETWLSDNGVEDIFRFAAFVAPGLGGVR